MEGPLRVKRTRGVPGGGGARAGLVLGLALGVGLTGCTQVGLPPTPPPGAASGPPSQRVGATRPAGPERTRAATGADTLGAAPGASELPVPPHERPAFRPGGEDAPDFDPDAIPDAVPARHPPSRYGNAETYEVFGRTYRVLPTSAGYEEEGIASWYGQEFHGRPTSSQEPFDMYAMTAAHPSLPIPVYVEVLNLDNGRRAVLRVNDRGPFHDDRVLDVSYAAALKLGMVEAGTARVRVRALEPVQTRR